MCIRTFSIFKHIKLLVMKVDRLILRHPVYMPSTKFRNDCWITSLFEKQLLFWNWTTRNEQPYSQILSITWWSCRTHLFTLRTALTLIVDIDASTFIVDRRHRLVDFHCRQPTSTRRQWKVNFKSWVMFYSLYKYSVHTCCHVSLH